MKQESPSMSNFFAFIVFVGLLGWFLWTVRPILTVPILYLSLCFFLWKYRYLEVVPVLWTVLSLLFVVYLFHLLKSLFPVAVFTLFFYLLLRPLVDFLETKKWKRGLAVLTVFLSVFGLLVLLASLIIPSLIDQVTFFGKLVPVYYERLSVLIFEKWIPAIQQLPFASEIPWDQWKASFLQWLKQILSATASYGTDFATKLGGWIGQILNIILVPILTLYLLLDRETLFDKLIKIIPDTKKPLVGKMIGNVTTILSRWLRGQLFVAAFLGCFTSLGLWIIGIDYPLMIGILTAILSFVPYVGLIISFLFALLIGFSGGGDFWVVVRIAIVYISIQFIEGNFITPKIMGHAVGLSDFVTIVVIAIGAQLFGFLGMIFAVPTVAMVWVTLREWYLTIYLPEKKLSEPNLERES